jgi:hypothetical protein
MNANERTTRLRLNGLEKMLRIALCGDKEEPANADDHYIDHLFREIKRCKTTLSTISTTKVSAK